MNKEKRELQGNIEYSIERCKREIESYKKIIKTCEIAIENANKELNYCKRCLKDIK